MQVIFCAMVLCSFDCIYVALWFELPNRLNKRTCPPSFRQDFSFQLVSTVTMYRRINNYAMILLHPHHVKVTNSF